MDIHGRYYPHRGVEIETPVILIGRDGDKVITAEEVGELADTFNYETLPVSRRAENLLKGFS